MQLQRQLLQLDHPVGCLIRPRFVAGDVVRGDESGELLSSGTRSCSPGMRRCAEGAWHRCGANMYRGTGPNLSNF
eukprot:scaffold23655_cov65-Phaeocystis_antarctica.AAC.3